MRCTPAFSGARRCWCWALRSASGRPGDGCRGNDGFPSHRTRVAPAASGRMAGRWSADWSLLFPVAPLERQDAGLWTAAAARAGAATRSIRACRRRTCRHRQPLRRLAAAARRCRHPCGTSGRRAIWGADVIESPLAMKTLFTVGPVPITEPVVTTWGIMAALALAGFLATRTLKLSPSRYQAVVELIVGAIADQIHGTLRVAPRPYVPLIGTLFLFILAANWSSLVPGVEPPTAHIETDAALGLIVFCSIIFFGVRVRGIGGYLRTFAEPTVLMIPLNLVETF